MLCYVMNMKFIKLWISNNKTFSIYFIICGIISTPASAFWAVSHVSNDLVKQKWPVSRTLSSSLRLLVGVNDANQLTWCVSILFKSIPYADCSSSVRFLSKAHLKLKYWLDWEINRWLDVRVTLEFTQRGKRALIIRFTKWSLHLKGSSLFYFIINTR